MSLGNERWPFNEVIEWFPYPEFTNYPLNTDFLAMDKNERVYITKCSEDLRSGPYFTAWAKLPMGYKDLNKRNML